TTIRGARSLYLDHFGATRAAGLLRLGEAAVRRAALELDRQAGQRDLVPDVLGRPGDVRDGDENPVSVGILELEVFLAPAVCALHHLGSRVAAHPVSRVHDQLSRLEWRGKFSGQLGRLTRFGPRLNTLSQIRE